MSENTILGRLEGLKHKFEEIGQQLADPVVTADMKKYVALSKEYRDLAPIVKACDEYRNLLSNVEAARDILVNEKDADMRELAREELLLLEARQPQLEEDIKLMLVPADPQDSRNAIVEIRAGTGGDEASIFAGDLFRMYSKYAEGKGWRLAVTSFSEGTVGGYKEVVMKVSGDKVYGVLKYESGVHRVQRVPQTETQGRVHT
ncbi:MAG: PCRF domain-containing protein, partial [Prevotellaceae bacterium]|nr:PCRF domain-containing protein [Prevotellaceae bacterium]